MSLFCLFRADKRHLRPLIQYENSNNNRYNEAVRFFNLGNGPSSLQITDAVIQNDEKAIPGTPVIADKREFLTDTDDQGFESF